MHKKLVFLLFSGVAGPAMAQTVPPQIAAEQVMFEPNNSGYALGQHGNANFKFAQTFQFDTVAEGDYKLAIFKPGKYVPKIVPITVGSTDHDCGALQRSPRMRP